MVNATRGYCRLNWVEVSYGSVPDEASVIPYASVTSIPRTAPVVLVIDIGVTEMVFFVEVQCSGAA
jgi:hypothetical protein